jgi:8-oxo-dGTP diphosphatase
MFNKITKVRFITMEYVAGFLFSKDRSKLAMVIKNRPKWQEGLFNAIGGKIELGELPINAMTREFFEETGVMITENEWIKHTEIRGNFGVVHFYKCFDDKVFNVKTMEDEVIQLIDPYHIPNNTIANIRWLVPLALDTHTATPEYFIDVDA